MENERTSAGKDHLRRAELQKPRGGDGRRGACGAGALLQIRRQHHLGRIGKTLWNGTLEEARAAIRGYTCGNDLSARDCQFRSAQWLTGKSMPGFAPIGPRIVSAEEFDPEKPHRIRCLVNGEVRQEDDVTNMIFSCAEIVKYCSSFFRLEPDDLIFTGTPAGVILGKPKGTRVWLKPGDTVQVEIEGIGSLTNRLV